MIPLWDKIPRQRWPLATLALVGVNIYVFLREVAASPAQLQAMVMTYGLVPVRTTELLSGGVVGAPQAIMPLFTSMFLHGGWMHLIGNMWFLWLFGDNVEDRLGHARYLLLYFTGGVAGAVTHLVFNLGSAVPTVGASGAIAGVMGAYLVTFPRARIVTLVPILIFLTTVEIPAVLILLYWLVLQFLSGMAHLAMNDASQGGVAWFAHVGGFLAGIPLMVLLRKGRR